MKQLLVVVCLFGFTYVQADTDIQCTGNLDKNSYYYHYKSPRPCVGPCANTPDRAALIIHTLKNSDTATAEGMKKYSTIETESAELKPADTNRSLQYQFSAESSYQELDENGVVTREDNFYASYTRYRTFEATVIPQAAVGGAIKVTCFETVTGSNFEDVKLK